MLVKAVFLFVCMFLSTVNAKASASKKRPMLYSSTNKVMAPSYLDFGEPVEVGEEGEFFFNPQGLKPDTNFLIYALVPIVESTDEFTVLEDGCAGHVIPVHDDCWVKIKFKPTSEGQKYYTYSLPYTYIWNVDGQTYSDGAWTVEYYSGVPRTNDPDPIDPKIKMCKNGSIVRVDGQSLGEHIPIVGTPFNLSYSSEYSTSYESGYRIGKIPTFNPFGWTIDIVHHYFSDRKRVYLGSGTMVRFPRESNFVVLSADGSEAYYFNNDGRHEVTTYASTGETKYLFAYESLSKRLASVTDHSGNVTTFSYASGIVTITAPFGQVTYLSIGGPDNLITTVTNPNSETHVFSYKSGTDLLQTFTKPGGQTDTFTYSSRGRLTKNQGHGGNSWTLLEELLPTERKVTMSSEMGISTVYHSYMINGDNSRNSTQPTGEQDAYTDKALNAGATNSSAAESSETTYVNDERFPLSGNKRISSLITTKNGISSTTLFGRSVSSSPATITDTESTSGRIKTRVFDKATNTAVFTSPMGATLTQVISKDKPLSVKIGTDTPTTFSYNSLGQLTQSIQGSFNSITNTYNVPACLHRLQMVGAKRRRSRMISLGVLRKQLVQI
jgi:hypothetical protein